MYEEHRAIELFHNLWDVSVVHLPRLDYYVSLCSLHVIQMQGSVRVSFPGLEKEIATEGAQAVSSMYVPCEPHHSGPHAKGMIAKTVHERVPAEHSRSVNAEAQNGQGMQVLQGDSFQQHQS